MLSVVLTGRNDSHGPNLEKRVALSLNGFAHQLGAEDEIVFVDWNTPDELPTLPEALWDVLTVEARARIRVLRVRPKTHALVGRYSPLKVMPSIAYNVGIRRCNPGNRWVLVSTTDMILVPRRVGYTLSERAEPLPEGHYGLPRFELPYALWVSLPRAEPDLVGEFLRSRGGALGLNEIVTTSGDHRFDAPGDFQLVLRRDLLAIDALNESMGPGLQNTDANLARRLTLLRGPVASLQGDFSGYHCEHTLGPAATHSVGRFENDDQFFVDDVDCPDLPEQRDRWGLPDEPVEELGLSAARIGGYIHALETLVSVPTGTTFEGSRAHDAFGRLDYPLEHVLPYLLGQLRFCAEGDVVGYVGPNAATAEALQRARSLLGHRGSLLVAGAPWPEFAPPDASVDLSVCELDDLLTRADLAFFDFGLVREPGVHEPPVLLASSGWSVRRTIRWVEEALTRLVEQWRGSFGRSARQIRIVAINAIHTDTERLVSDCVEVTLGPYTTRLRSGWLRSSGTHRKDIGGGGNADLPATFPPDIATLVADLARRLERSPDRLPATGWSDYSAALVDFLADAACTAVLGLKPLTRDALERLVEQRRPSTQLASRLRHPAHVTEAARRPALSGLVAAEDWDDAGWRRCAVYRQGEGATTYRRRHRVDWERIQYIFALSTNGLLHQGAQVAVITAGPDDIVADLLCAGASVDLLAARTPEQPAPDDCLRLARSFPLERLSRPRSWPGEVGRYDAVIVPQNSTWIDSTRSMARILAWAQSAIRPGGLLCMAHEAVLTDPAPEIGFSLAALSADDGLAACVSTVTTFDVVGRVDPSISRATLDRTRGGATADIARPHLISSTGDGLHTACVVTYVHRQARICPWSVDTIQARLDLLLGRDVGATFSEIG